MLLNVYMFLIFLRSSINLSSSFAIFGTRFSFIDAYNVTSISFVKWLFDQSYAESILLTSIYRIKEYRNKKRGEMGFYIYIYLFSFLYLCTYISLFFLISILLLYIFI